MKGKFIVIEGIDKSGKTTICKKIADLLSEKREIVQIRFPERKTDIGKIIDSYLRKEVKCNKQVIHLLFSANRWEFNDKISDLIKNGNIIICDRYYYSGIAYSMSNGLSREWCYGTDSGLIEPDLVIFIDITPNMVNQRYGFGGEIYESIEYLTKAYTNLKEIIKEKNNHLIINGLDTPEQIADSIVDYLLKNIF